ncbi:MAG TPA: HAD-IIA family hydrolase [Candidatus Binatia bacterium]|nr:HAD-IIA family hydrolase [Candidatus Binatia bacterium]
MLLLVDLDGVVYRGAEPVPGVAAVLADRAARGDEVVYVTNNSMHYRADYVTRLAAMGAPVTPDRVVSSSRATALYLRAHQPSVHRVVTIGARGLERELADVGLDVVPAAAAAERAERDDLDGYEAAGRPDAVVVGVDPHIDYARIGVAADCIRGGARFIATNRDPVYPIERRLRPGAGSIVAAIATAAGREPAVSIGKPEPLLLEEAAEAVGRRAADGVMIGDGIGTDLAAARAVGARSVLMLTGVTTRSLLAGIPDGEGPTAVAADAAELADALDRLAAERPTDGPPTQPQEAGSSAPG